MGFDLRKFLLHKAVKSKISINAFAYLNACIPISISHDDHNINKEEIVFLFLEGFALPT